MSYIKNKSNFVIQTKHQQTNDGVIFERDFTTIGGVDNFSNNSLPIYKSGNFILTVNEEQNPSHVYDKNNWVKNDNDNEIWCLRDISKNDSISSSPQISYNKIFDLRDFAYYGSCSELIRISINNIINTFPGELYVTVNIDDNNVGEKYKYAINDGYRELSLKKETTVNIYPFTMDTITDIYLVDNPFGVDLHSESIAFSESSDNHLGYFADDGYQNFEIIDKQGSIYSIDDWGVNIINHNAKKNEYIGCVYLSFNGGILMPIFLFNDSNCSIIYLTSQDFIGYHIRPNKIHYDNFIKNLTTFEKILLNQDSKEKYTSRFEIISENEFGLKTDIVEFKFPIGKGGYNIDITSASFYNYVKTWTDICGLYDDMFCDNLYRSMTHESIKNFDFTKTIDESNDYLFDEYNNSANKIASHIRIIASEFDRIKLLIDGIKNVNDISYDKNLYDDKFLLNIVNMDGWDINNINNYKISNSGTLVENNNILISGKSVLDINDCFLRNLKLNSRNIIKNKGTINGIEMLLALFGLQRNVNYDIKEYITMTRGIIDRYDDSKNNYIIDWFNSTKLIPYSSNEYLTGGYVSYQGLPVIIENETKEYRILYPYFDKNEEIDGKPYYQMNGGWIHKELFFDKNNNFINNKTFTETANKILSVNTINDLFKLNDKILYDGLICRVDDLSNNSVIIDSTIYDLNIKTIGNTTKYFFNVTVLSNSVYFGDKKYDKEIIRINDLVYNLNAMNNSQIISIPINISNPSLNINDEDINISIIIYGNLINSEPNKPNYFCLNQPIQPKYTLRIDNDNSDTNNDIYKQEDIFMWYGYKANETDKIVPVLYKTDVKALDNDEYNNPDLDDVFFYNGTKLVDGVEYDIWRKIETSNAINNIYTWESEKKFLILTDKIVYNDFIVNKEASYFKLIKKEYKNKINSKGWSLINKDSVIYNQIMNIKNYYDGNNPHIGKMNYDLGNEYISYFTNLFKYAAENNLFDRRCFNDYNQEIAKIKEYGFKDIINDDNSNSYHIYEDNKVNFYGKYYNEIYKSEEIKILTAKPSDIDIAMNKECYIDTFINKSYTTSIKNINYNDYSDKLSNMKFGKPLDNELANNNSNHSIINTKRLSIIFFIEDINKIEDIKFIDSCIIPYLSQMLPTSAICEIKYEKMTN